MATYTSSGSGSPIVLSNIPAGTYSVTVSAHNSVGNGPASTAGSVTVTSNVTTPGAPTMGTVTAGNASATVSFSAPSSNGGATITSYTATSSPGNFTGTVNSITPITVTGLTNGTTYTFTVRATNSAGTGSPSGSSASIVPTAPSSANFVQRSGTGFTLNGSAYKPFFGSINGASTPASAVVTYAQNLNLNSVRLTDFINTSGTIGTADRDPTVWAKVDAIIAGMSAAGMKTILDLSCYRNMLRQQLGVVQAYTYDWTGFLNFVVNRVNTVSGLTYKNDPGILYVAFAGEPDGPSYNNGNNETATQLTTFYQTVTNYWRTQGGQHLLTPGGWLYWDDSSVAGINVSGIYSLPNVDFIGIHSYSSTDLSAGVPRIAAAASTAGKPWVNEEFGQDITTSGQSDSSRATYFNARYSADDAQTPKAAGEGFWNMTMPGGGVGGYDVAVGSLTATAIANRATGSTSTVPGAPSISSVSAGSGSATITFAAPSSNGGATITSYTATSNPGGFTGTVSSVTPITVSGLTNGTAYTFTVKATNSVGTGAASSASSAVTPTGGSYPNTPVMLPALTRSNTNLQVNGSTVKTAGYNAYWLGLDDNAGTNSGSYPSQSTITSAMSGMRGMGANLVRAHTVGISVGMSNGNGLSYATYSTSNGAVTYNDNALAAADWAVYQASLQGIYLMVPLTDNWNYYHGGKWVFCHAAYLQNNANLTDCPGTTKDDTNERQFFGAASQYLRIRNVFKDYISHLLNHVNQFTGVAYKNDPTIAIMETGNEIYVLTQPNATPVAPDSNWTQDIASYIKSIAPNKLVSDGSAASGTAVSTMQGLTASSCDIMSNHYYPQNPSGGYSSVGFTVNDSDFPSGSAISQLAADATAASGASKPFILGEYPWTRSDVASLYSAIESNSSVSGDMPWAFIAGTESHGGSYGSDDVAVHWPYESGTEATYAPALATHIHNVSGVALASGAGPASPTTGTNLLQNLSTQHASTVTQFTAGGSSTLSVDSGTSLEGGTSIKVTTTASGAYPYFYPTNPVTDGAPVTAGSSYVAMASIHPASNTIAYTLVVSFYTSSGTYITPSPSTQFQSPNVTCASGAWTQIKFTVTAPATAAYAIVQPQASAAMGGTGDWFNVDEFGIFAGNTVNTWSASG